MPANPRTIRRRIKSVKNTRKITKAMELVAASKMRRAVSSVLGTRPFSGLAWSTMKAVSAVTDPMMHPLLAPREHVRRILLILFTSDRGLCGGFNAKMLKEAIKTIRENDGTPVDVITVGSRGADAMRRLGLNVIASFTELSNQPKFEDILPIVRLAMNEYRAESYDRVVLGYTNFISAITQKPQMADLLPLTVEELEAAEGDRKPVEYIFEPSPQVVLDRLLPRIIETIVWQALLESSASEHSARMMAMRSASDAAAEMVDSLTFTFNQARQAAITREIAEISGGKAALE